MTKNDDSIKLYTVETLVPVFSQLKGFLIYSLQDFAKHIHSLEKTHRHDFYSLIIIESGKGSHSIDSKTYSICKNRIFLLTYGQIHAWEELSNAKGYIIVFTKSFYNHIYTGNNKIKSDLISYNDIPYIDVDDRSIKEWMSLAQLIYNEYLREKKQHKELICIYLKAALVKYSRYYSSNIETITVKKDHQHMLIQQFNELVDLKYKHWKLPKNYADEMSISPHYLNVLTKKTLGKTTGSIIKSKVILEAERLLKNTDLTVSEIGYILGFNDKSNFNKYFKKLMNCTPESFRKNDYTNN